MTTIAEPVALFARNACLSSSTRLPAISSERNVPPVKLRPGRARLFAMPSSTGSPLMAKSTGTSSTGRTPRIAGPLETMNHLHPSEVGDRRTERVEASGRVAELEHDVLALHVATPAQPFAKPVQEGIGLGLGGQPADTWQRPGRLRAGRRRQQPRHRANDERPAADIHGGIAKDSSPEFTSPPGLRSRA